MKTHANPQVRNVEHISCFSDVLPSQMDSTRKIRSKNMIIIKFSQLRKYHDFLIFRDFWTCARKIMKIPSPKTFAKIEKKSKTVYLHSESFLRQKNFRRKCVAFCELFCYIVTHRRKYLAFCDNFFL